MDIVGLMTFLFQEAASGGGPLNWLQTKFVEGGGFMWPILFTLIFGLAYCIERLWTLNRAQTDTKKFLISVKNVLFVN